MGGDCIHHLLGQIFDEDQRSDEDIGFSDIRAERGVVIGVPELFDQVAREIDGQIAALRVEAGGGLGQGVLVLRF